MRALWNAPRVKDEGGAAAVEVALVALLLMMIISATIEFGSAYNELQVMTSAAREGARYAAVRHTADEISTRIEEATAAFETTTSPVITVDGAGGTCTDDTTGDPVEVSWTQSFEITIFGLPAFSPDAAISGTFRCE